MNLIQKPRSVRSPKIDKDYATPPLMVAVKTCGMRQAENEALTLMNGNTEKVPAEKAGQGHYFMVRQIVDNSLLK